MGMNVNGGRDNTMNYTVDGVSNIDTGNNGVLGSINLDAGRGVQDPDERLRGRVRPVVGRQVSLVTKSGGRDYRGSATATAVRNRSTPTAASTTASAAAPSRRTRLDGRPQADQPPDRHGFTSAARCRSAATTRTRTACSSSSPSRTRPQHAAGQPEPRQGADGARTARATSRSRSTTTTGPTTSFATTHRPALHRDQHQRLLPGRRRARPHPGQAVSTAPAWRILRAYPEPNVPNAAGYNYESQVAVKIDRREEIFRADWQASSAWRLYGRYFHNSNNAGAGIGPYGSFNLTGNLPGSASATSGRSTTSRCSATGVLSPSLFAEVTFGTGHNSIYIHDEAGKFTRANLGVSALPLLYPDAVQQDLPPWFQLSGRFGNQANFNSSQSPFTNFNTTYDILGNLTKVWGRHTSKVGVYMQKSLKDQTSFTNHNGVINFNEDTSNPFDTSFAAANAATGVFNSYTQANAYSNGKYRYWNIEWFAQDNWKVNDRLTLDYGLRFYWVQPQFDEAGLGSNFIPSLYQQNQAVRLYRPGLNAAGQRIAVDPVTGQQLAAVNIGRIVPNSGSLTNGIGQSGDAGVPDRLIEDNGILFAPRFGLTYDITGNQSFIFRAGGGVFYDRYEGNISFALISNPPTTFTPAIRFGRLQEVDPNNALLAPTDPVNAQAASGQVPSTYNFNAGFQKKLPGGMIWDIAYVGSIANHLPRQVNLNAVPYGARFLPENQDPTLPTSTLPGQNAYDANFLRPYQGYGNINLRLYDANSNYHGLQTQVDRRFSNGLFLNANYTFSKALDTQD
jgi:hypothetical protein